MSNITMSSIVLFLIRLSLVICFAIRLPRLSEAQSVSNLLLRDLTSPSQCSGPKVAADPDQPFGIVFASCFNGIVAINGTQVRMIVPSSPSCASPQGMDVHNGVLYAACFLSGRYNPASPTVVQVNFTNNEWIVSTVVTYGQCMAPDNLQIDRSNGRVYVLCSQSIISIDGTNVSPLVPYDMCHFPSAVSAAACSHGGDIIVGCATDTDQPSRLLGVNPVTGNVTVIVDFDARCQNPTAIVRGESGVLYVACLGDATPTNEGSIVAVHGPNVSSLLSVCSQIRAIALHPASGFIFLNCDINSVVTFHPSAPAATLTTLVQADRCENAESMQILLSSPQVAQHSSTPSLGRSSFSLLIGCRNSDIVMLATGDIPARVSDLADFNIDDAKFVPRT